MPNGNETIYNRIDCALEKRQMSRRKLAQQIGIPPSTLQSAFEKSSNLSVERLTQIADALSVDINWLLNCSTLEEHNEAFIRRLQHKEPKTERDLYLEKHPDDIPAPKPERSFDLQHLVDGLDSEGLKMLEAYAEFLMNRKSTGTPPDAPGGVDDKGPAEK